MARGRTSALAIAAVLVLAACGSDDSSEAATTSTAGAVVTEPTTTDATTSDPPTETAPPATVDTSDDGAAAAGGDIVGQWIADAGDVLRTLTAPFGGEPPDCSGPYVLIFGPDGSWASDIDLTCAIGDLNANGEIGAVGRYTTDGTTLQILDAAPSGALTVAGTPVPIDLEGFFAGYSVPATYTIERDTLTMDLTTPDGIDYTLEFTRLV
jgi:ABC-type glycerol-3-phosphate transport system substrate-binding protein